MENLIGKRVTTDDGHSGIVIKHYKVTGGGMSVHIKQDDGRIWYCPDSNITIIHKRENKKIITDKRALEVKSGIDLIEKLQRVEYIPKQKVKDKIEELNNYYKKEIYPERFNWADVNITEYYDGMIEILQDLLEEKGENDESI